MELVLFLSTTAPAQPIGIRSILSFVNNLLWQVRGEKQKITTPAKKNHKKALPFPYFFLIKKMQHYFSTVQLFVPLQIPNHRGSFANILKRIHMDIKSKKGGGPCKKSGSLIKFYNEIYPLISLVVPLIIAVTGCDFSYSKH